MDGFKKQLKTRQVLLAVGLTLAGVVVSLTGHNDPTMPDFLRGFIEGFQVGLLAALFGVTVFYLIRYLRAMRDPEMLKKLFVSETDERKLFIQQKAGSVGFSIALFGLTLGTVVAGNYDIKIFLTLLGATVFVSLIGISLKMYYHSKF